MKAVILAAGVGSRLRPLTNEKPKCLVKVAGKEILKYQLDSYVSAGIKEICIITGYEGDKIKDYCKHFKEANITIIHNEDYENTNNMYSLFLAKSFVSGDAFILNNADLAISSRIVPILAYSEHEDLVAVDRSQYNEESMKVSVNQDGYIVDISKGIGKDDAYACSIDFYKFSKNNSKILFDHIENIISSGNLKDWTEVAMQDLFQSGSMKCRAKDIQDENWVEIDNYQDLALAEKKFSKFDFELNDIDSFFVDLDGTVYLDGVEIDGSIKTINEWQNKGKSVFFLSNNSSKSKSQYVEKLHSLGLELNEEQIILSTDGAIAFLKEAKVESVYVLGTAALVNEIEINSIKVTNQNPEYVVVGYDTELTYEKLKETCELINDGVDYIATHCDVFCPTPKGPIPDIGSFITMIELTTGVSPSKVFGKPSPEMIECVFSKNSLNPKRSAIVGDRLHTDIKIAEDAGAKSILVMSGETTREVYEDSNITVDLCLDKLSEFYTC